MNMSESPSNHDALDGTPEFDAFFAETEDEPPQDFGLSELDFLEKRRKAQLIAEHRKKFNALAFGNTLSKGKNKRILSKEDYEYHISVLRYWNVEEGHTDPITGKHISQEQYRRRFPKHRN